MKKYVLLLILTACLFQLGFAQQSSSPYEWDWTRDGIWTGLGLAGSVGGFLLIQNKEGLTESELAEIVAKQENINFMDRWVAGNYSEDASKLSDIPFGVSFAVPFALLLDDGANEHAGQLFGIYIESLATTAALFTMTAGLVNRNRPYVYNDELDLNDRLSAKGQRSFYSGHVAAAATATFFTAKVYSDFNPEAEGKVWIWTGAAVVPGLVGYLRMEAGQHFLTDVLLGYGLGAVTGYFVPELHKSKNDAMSFYPVGGENTVGDSYKGLALRYTF